MNNNIDPKISNNSLTISDTVSSSTATAPNVSENTINDMSVTNATISMTSPKPCPRSSQQWLGACHIDDIPHGAFLSSLQKGEVVQVYTGSLQTVTTAVSEGWRIGVVTDMMRDRITRPVAMNIHVPTMTEEALRFIKVLYLLFTNNYISSYLFTW